ncbi:MAG: helix-turn-helix transcriptional regulator [Candidatus Gracilibacteria bacterium]|nr:helix-turn-helix transcriptional regulator [Candidatus Gracilibacteria bacterium]
MLEKQIKDFLKEKNLKQSDVYTTLDISKQNFYKAIRTKNFDNPTLQKILDFLGLEIIILLQEKDENPKKNYV